MRPGEGLLSGATKEAGSYLLPRALSAGGAWIVGELTQEWGAGRSQWRSLPRMLLSTQAWSNSLAPGHCPTARLRASENMSSPMSSPRTLRVWPSLGRKEREAEGPRV